MNKGQTLGLQDYPSWATIPDVVPQGPPGMLSRIGGAIQSAGRFLFADQLTRVPRDHDDDFIDLVTAAYGAKALAVVAVVVGILERGMYSARVTGDAGMLTPNVLATAATRLLLDGSVCFLKVSSGQRREDGGNRSPRPMLIPATAYNVQSGGIRPSSWQYQVSMPAPGGGQTVMRRRRDVLHVQFVGDKSTPWRGKSPLDRASVTSAPRLWIGASITQGSEYSCQAFVCHAYWIP